MRSPTLSVTATDTGGRGIQFYSDFYLTLPQTSTLAGCRRTAEDHGKARATIIAKGEMRSRGALKLSVRDLLEGKQETLPGPVRKFEGEKQRKHYLISKNVLLSWT